MSIVNLAVLSLFVFLSTLQFDSINSQLVGERLSVLAGRTAAPFVAAAKIGLPLSTVRNAEALLERAKQTDGAILGIHVFDTSGRIVHTTAAARDAVIPGPALATWNTARGERWHIETSAGFYSGVDVANSAGESFGGILVVYPSRASVTRTRAMLAELAIVALVVAVLMAGLSSPLLRLGLKSQINDFESIDDQISQFERGAWRSAAGSPADGNRTGALRELLDSAEARYRRTGQTLTEIAGCAGADRND